MTGRPPPSVLFGDGKEPGAMRTIGEVSAALGIKPHILRYWEQQFPQLAPLKRSGGRRLYRAQDVAVVMEIDRLVNQQGYTLKGAAMALRQPASPVVPSPPQAAATPGKAAEVVGRLREIRQRLADLVDG